MAKNKIINMVKSQVIYKDYSKDAERTALVSGENLSHMFGKIARWYTDISWVGHTHTEANITDFGTYAGASTKGGAATSANKLNIGSADIGSETKPVYFSYLTGKPVACTYSLNASVPANAVFTDINVKQSPSTANESREVLFASNTGNTETTGTVGKSNKLYFNPNTGALTATSFSGSLAASNLTGTIDAGRLPTTAVTAGSYGPAAGGTLTYGGTFDVPYVTVDKYGRLTNASTKTFTMPAQYTHPSYTSKTSGLYKITVDATGHVSGTAAVTASDLPAHTHPYLPESIVTGSPDLDTYLTTGVYHIKTQTSEHAPTTNHATLFVDGTVGTPYQLFIPDVSNGVWYSRYKSGSSAWSSWLSLKMTDTVYTHPTYTSKTSGLYKITVDGTGHVSATAAVAAADLPSHTHSYLPLAGGTMTGVITLPKDKYRSSECGLDCNNSNIINANNIKFGDTPDTDGSEGIHYYRSATTWDSLWGKDGALYFTPNFPTGTTHYTIYHSGNLTYSTIGAAPTSHTHRYAKSSSVNGPAYSVEGSQGTANVDRHIWFSFATDETRRAYSDNFKYNPDTNIITVGAVGISPSFAVQTGSSKVARITFETFITWLTNTKKAVPKSYPVHKILRTTWVYADNDILQITADGTNYEIQLAGVVIEIHGTIATYNTGEWRMKIYTAPAVNGFAPTTGYTKAPVSSIFTYTCNGSGYAPTWRLLSYSNHTHNYIPNTQAGVIAGINLLREATAIPVDDCWYISQENDATTTNFYKRKHSALWDYIKGKADSTYAAKSHSHNYAGSTSAGGDAIAAQSLRVTHGNEINSSKPGDYTYIWFFYRWNDGGTEDTSGSKYISTIYFGNGNGAGTNTSVGRFANLQFNNIAAGTLRHTGAVASWWNDRNAAMLYQTYGDSYYRPLWGTETKDNCSWCCGNYNNNNLMFNYISASTYNSGMNPSVYYQISFTTEAKIEARGYNVINNGSGRLVMDYAGISMTNSRTGSWAAGIDMKNASGTLLSAIGFYGTDTALTYTYLGGAYNDPIIKLESSGYATFKDGMKVNNNISLQETKNIILRPNLSSYTAGIGYDTSGNECIAIWAKNTVTRLRWYAGTDMSSLPSGTMMGITPDFEISKASGTAKGYIAGDSIVTYKILWSGSTSCTARSSTSITLTTSISANKYRSIRVVWNCGTYTGISEFRADTLNVTNNVPTGSDATTTNMIQFKIASDGKSITVGPGTAAITMLQVAGVCVI